MKHLLFAALTVAVLGSSTPVSAQSLRKETITFFCAAAADQLTTVRAFHHGAVEKNPMYAFAGRNSFKMSAASTAVDITTAVVANRINAAGHHRIASTTLLVLSALRFDAAIGNVMLVRQMDAIGRIPPNTWVPSYVGFVVRP